MQTPDGPPSLLSPIGYQKNSCGYCHNNSGSQSPKRFSYYASTTSLSPAVYQSLLNHGWRRSGSLLYKPDQHASCCRQYTIRLDSESFHTSKDQRQTVNRFNKYVLGDQYIKDAAKLYPLSREQAKKRNTDFDVVERVHEAETERLKTPLVPLYSLLVTLEPDNFTEEKYTLFENYQRIVHKEPPGRISKSGFKNFLCSSPLPRSQETFDGKDRQLGSYHQCYRMDGKLVAVGVLDLLPQCVSAVYFMYHESVHQYGFGKLGAMREIALAKEKGYKWWYAGFYIHNCVKMRYKGDYTPQYMLDPESYNWLPLDEQLKKNLDSNKYPNESNIPTTDPMDTEEDEETSLFSKPMPGLLSRDQLLTDIDLDQIKIRVRGQVAEAGDLSGWEESNIDDPNAIKGIIADLVSAVGKEVAGEMIVTFGSG